MKERAMKDDREPSRQRPSGGILPAWLIAALAVAMVWVLSIVDSRTPNHILLEIERTLAASQ